MGTRSVTYVYEGGECRLALYTQFDSHFSSMGKDLLGFVSNKKNLEKLRQSFSKCDPVTTEELRAWSKAHPNHNSYDDYIDSHPDFLYGSAYEVLCKMVGRTERFSVEYVTGDMRIEDRAYVIDLDRMTFEAYKGINKKPLREDERFYDGPEPNERGYYPFRECGVFDLNDLPSADDFIEICEENAYGPS